MLFAELVATSDAVSATRARSAKVAALSALLSRLAPDEIVPAVGMLTGQPRQRRTGVGWATISAIDVRPADSPTLTILDVDHVMSELPTFSGAGSATARTAAVTALFSTATQAETDFLRRLFAGELRQGALAGIMADAVGKAWSVPLAAVRRAAMLEGDLARIAALARAEGEAGLATIGLRIFQPLQPMLAATSADVAEAMAASGDGPASVEWKLDGARIQVHRQGDDVRLYTRNLNEVTDRLPGIVAATRTMPVESVVLDGEAIGVGESDRPDLFQETVSRFARQDGVAGAGLVARFFDVLHVDGDDLLDEPLSKRLEVLDQVAGPWRIPGIVTDDVATAQRFADDAIAAGQEGVMVKAIDSTYDAGRRGGAWRKVKPVKTLDLVVLAAEWGHGRRTGWLSNLHLGARNPDPQGGFVMVGKTFKGLTDELLRWQTETFPAYATREERHVMWLRPALVVEIALDGVQVSPRYPGGVALRFARVRRYRPDKTPAEADTIDTVRSLLGTGEAGGP